MSKAYTSNGGGLAAGNSDGPVGFWFINGQPSPNIVGRQLDEFVAQGFSGVVLHPRDGLPVPYPSKRWFELLGYLIDECVSRGLEPWFYDENPFPTGTAGGALLNQYPELVGHSLAFTGHDAEVSGGSLRLSLHGQGRLLRVFMLRSEQPADAAAMVDVTDYAGLVADDWYVQGRRTEGYGPIFADDTCDSHVRAWAQKDCWVIDYPTDNRSGMQRVMAVWLVPAQTTRGRQYVDLLNPVTTQRFIELTHEAALHHLGAERLGQCVASFTDEPHLASPYPWTAALPEAYKDTYGDDLMALLPHLATDIDDRSPMIRHRYRHVLGKMWERAFAQPMAKWCAEHDLSWTGHSSPEEDPLLQTLHVPGWARITAAMHWPGVDQISSSFPSPSHPHLLLGPKFVASLAHQHGRSHTMGEALGVSGENLTLSRMQRVITSLAVCGIDRFVLHGQMMSMAGHRKREAPPSIFCQAPYWPHMGQLSQYIATLSQWLQSGKPHRPIAVLYPTAAFEALLPARHDEAIALARDLAEVIGRLMAAGLDFDLVPDHDLALQPVSRDGEAGFAVGAALYQTLVIPAAPFLNQATVDAVNALCNAGIPVHRMAKTVQVLESQTRWCEPMIEHHTVGNLVCELVDSYRNWLDVNARRDVYVHTRVQKDGQRESLLWNPSNEPLSMQLCLGDGAGRGWVPGGGPLAEVGEADANGVAMISLHPWQAVVVRSDSTLPKLISSSPTEPADVAHWGEWRLRPHHPNTLLLRRWNVIDETGTTTPIMLPARTSDWDCHNGLRMRLRYQFICEDSVRDAAFVWEEDAFDTTAKLSFNGHVLEGTLSDSGEYHAAVGQLLQLGVNTLELDIDALASSDMAVQDPPRLCGTFAVTRLAREVDHNNPVNKTPGWYARLSSQEHLLDVVAPAVWPIELAEAVDWASVGFPNYSGTMTYESCFRIDSSEQSAFIRLSSNQVDPFSVLVNGQYVGACCWPPYEVDITEALQVGENIVEFQVSNTRINQGEGIAQASGLIGMPRVFVTSGSARKEGVAAEVERSMLRR